MAIDDSSGRDAAIAWAKEHLDRAVNELIDAGRLAGITIEARPSWALPGRYVIGQVRDNSASGTFIWVIAGDFQTDTVDSAAAATARDAARHFSLKWQLDAERSPEAADAMIRRAEDLYAVVESDEAWKNIG